MGLGVRIKKIRELKGMSRKAIAEKMKVSEHVYRTIEEGDNPKYSTVKKFCDVIGTNLSFLLAEDVPITGDAIHLFDSLKDRSFFLSFEQLRQKVEVYSEIFGIDKNR